jgi:hypothetical protein
MVAIELHRSCGVGCAEPCGYFELGQPALEVPRTDFQQPVGEPVSRQLVQAGQLVGRCAGLREGGTFGFVPVVADEGTKIDNVKRAVGA